MEVSRDKYLLVVFLVVWCAVTGATGHPAVFFSPDPICASDWVDHLHPFDPLAPRDQSGPALGMLAEHCPNQPLQCCLHHTVNDIEAMTKQRDITSVLDSFFQEQLHILQSIRGRDLYGIGDILVRTISKELPMLEPIELNLVRSNIQDTFCKASNEFAQDVDEPLCHPTGAETKAKANFILAGTYTSAAMTAMGHPGRLLPPQAERCVRAYTTRSYRSYTRHVETLSCALRALQCQIKPALLALQSMAELFDRVRSVINSPQFPGPKCKHARMVTTVCPYCSGQGTASYFQLSGQPPIPQCLSSCTQVVQICLSEVMNDQLEGVFLPVVRDARERLAAMLDLTETNLAIARKTIHDIILEANRDVVDRTNLQAFKEEVHQACRLSHHLTDRYEPQACQHMDQLAPYGDILHQAYQITQQLEHNFETLDNHHAQQLCPKAVVPGSDGGMCVGITGIPEMPNVRLEEFQLFQHSVKDILDLFITRNHHLFDHVAANPLNLMYDDEDSQGSYLDVSEEGSGGSSGSASGSAEDMSGSGNGNIDTTLRTQLVMKKFKPDICRVPQEAKTVPPPKPTTTVQRATATARATEKSTQIQSLPLSLQSSLPSPSSPTPAVSSTPMRHLATAAEPVHETSSRHKSSPAQETPRITSGTEAVFVTQGGVNLGQHGSGVGQIHPSSTLVVSILICIIYLALL